MPEIERKFLLAAVPAEASRWVTIRQGYLCHAPSAEARIRDKGGRYTLTCKQGTGLVRDEWEVPLTPEQFSTLWPATIRARIEKRRGILALGDLTIEIDVFDGLLAGLLIAEVEFPTVEAAHTFVRPVWLAREVTGDPAFTNKALATAPAPPRGSAARDLKVPPHMTDTRTAHPFATN